MVLSDLFAPLIKMIERSSGLAHVGLLPEEAAQMIANLLHRRITLTGLPEIGQPCRRILQSRCSSGSISAHQHSIRLPCSVVDYADLTFTRRQRSKLFAVCIGAFCVTRRQFVEICIWFGCKDVFEMIGGR